MTNPSVERWARFNIVGDPDATTPTTAALTLASELVLSQLMSEYPCITQDSAGLVLDLAGDDLLRWYQWAGAETALAYLDTFAGRAYRDTLTRGAVTSEKQGDRSRSYGSGGTATRRDPLAVIRTYGTRARILIACIAAALPSRGESASFGLAGRRRTLTAQYAAESECGCVPGVLETEVE